MARTVGWVAILVYKLLPQHNQGCFVAASLSRIFSNVRAASNATKCVVPRTGTAGDSSGGLACRRCSPCLVVWPGLHPDCPTSNYDHSLNCLCLGPGAAGVHGDSPDENWNQWNAGPWYPPVEVALCIVPHVWPCTLEMPVQARCRVTPGDLPGNSKTPARGFANRQTLPDRHGETSLLCAGTARDRTICRRRIPLRDCLLCASYGMSLSFRHSISSLQCALVMDRHASHGTARNET